MENYIITYNGEKALKKNCRFIKGEFYIKNKQCFNIDGTWYRINSGYIAKDHETNKYVLIKGSNLVRGIVEYDPENDNITIGYFTPNDMKNVTVMTPTGSYTAISKDILKNNFYFDLYNLHYKHYSIKKSPNWNKINEHGNLSSNPYINLQYNLRNIDNKIVDEVRDISDLFIEKYIPREEISRQVNSLPNYTYGLEFETNSGIIPGNELAEAGMFPLRDGSIRGIEYVTLPHSSKNIGKAVSKACSTLNTFTKISINESLHLHIGNIKKVDQKFVGILYTLCCVLEKEIFLMFPKYYAQTSKFKVRGKDYNKPLVKALVDPDPLVTFDNVSTYLAAGKRFSGFGSAHPSDPDGSHKWAVETRYHYMNIINLLFGNNKTVEFRVHVPTKNPIKIMNWIFICSAIVKYAEYLASNDVSMDSIRGVKLDNILTKLYDRKLSVYLSDYIHYRKIMRSKDDSHEDYIGTREIEEDLLYNIDF